MVPTPSCRASIQSSPSRLAYDFTSSNPRQSSAICRKKRWNQVPNSYTVVVTEPPGTLRVASKDTTDPSPSRTTFERRSIRPFSAVRVVSTESKLHDSRQLSSDAYRRVQDTAWRIGQADLMFQCPCCGFEQLDFEPWTGDSPSDEICPCCGMRRLPRRWPARPDVLRRVADAVDGRGQPVVLISPATAGRLEPAFAAQRSSMVRRLSSSADCHIRRLSGV